MRGKEEKFRLLVDVPGCLCLSSLIWLSFNSIIHRLSFLFQFMEHFHFHLKYSKKLTGKLSETSTFWWFLAPLCTSECRLYHLTLTWFCISADAGPETATVMAPLPSLKKGKIWLKKEKKTVRITSVLYSRHTNAYIAYKCYFSDIFDISWDSVVFNYKLYYISQLVRELWLVNLACRALLHDPLNFEVVFVAKLFRDLSPNGLYTYIASKSLKLPKNERSEFCVEMFYSISRK